MKRNPTSIQHVPAQFDPVTGRCWLWHWPSREWHRASSGDTSEGKDWNPINNGYLLWMPDSEEMPGPVPAEYSIVFPNYEIKPIIRTAQGYLAGDPDAFVEDVESLKRQLADAKAQATDYCQRWIEHGEEMDRLTKHAAALSEENERLKKELKWHAHTLSVFSANIPAEATIDRTYVSGRLSEANKLLGTEEEIRPYEEPAQLTTLRQWSEAQKLEIEELKRRLGEAPK